MLTLNISQADIVSANYERIHNPILAIRKRMDAIYWSSQGYSRQEVALQAGVHRNSVKNYIKLYHLGGLESLKTFQYKGFESLLSGYRTTLEDYFRKNPPRTAKEAAAKVEELTGQNLSVDEARRFMHQIGMKPLKTGHVPGKADPELVVGRSCNFVYDPFRVIRLYQKTVLQFRQKSLCTHSPEPQTLHFHFSSSVFKNSSSPLFFMYERFSSMLMPYFVLYLLSRFFNLEHGYFLQS